MLETLDGGASISSEGLESLVMTTRCGAGHPTSLAVLQTSFFKEEGGEIRATVDGQRWLIEAGRPASDWSSRTANGSPALREWQIEALDAWAHHGRIGVVEAVTGTGKSRVGVEAVREALSDDYSAVIAVPTRDLVQQWCMTLRGQGISGVAPVGDGVPPRFGNGRRVLVGTVQSLYMNPPVRADGKVLLVADECHRYGSEQWKRMLSPSYRRRLGLTATFERNDEGLDVLLRYFGGTPCFRIGFDRAVADGVVAHYDVKLLGVQLSRTERGMYDAAHEAVVDCRQRLIAEGVSEEPFGLFMKVVSEYARGDDSKVPIELVDLSRRYLKNFHERIRILSESRAKIAAAEDLAPRVRSSHGAVVFTRSILASEELSRALCSNGVVSEAIHSNLSLTERKERLHRLKIGRTQSLVAPTVLDEGIDVPQIDLGIVMGGSKSRRQMIQRMGRVLRLKPDGGRATFIVVYAEDTVEDITQNDGQEGCLDLIVQSADSVEHLDGKAQPIARRKSTEEGDELMLKRPGAAAAPAVVPSPAALHATTTDVDAKTLPMTRSALDSYQRAHGGGDATAEAALRDTLAGLLRIARPTPSAGQIGSTTIRASGFKIIYARDRFQTYSCSRSDGRSWPEASHQWELTRSRRMPEFWTERPWPESPTSRLADTAISTLGHLTDLSVSGKAVDDHVAAHGGGREDADEQIRLLVQHLEIDRDRCRKENGRLIVARSGYGIEVDIVARLVVGYKNSGQYRRYGDYVEFGRAEDHLAKLPLPWRAPDGRLDVSNLAEFREVVDPSTIYYSNRTYAALTETLRLDFVNSWDADRYVRDLIASDLERATDEDFQIFEDRFVLEGDGRTWMMAPDGQSAKISRKRRERQSHEVDGDDLGVTERSASVPITETGPVPVVEEHHVEEAADAAARPAHLDWVSALAQLAELYGTGALTDDEFAMAKARVLRG